MNYPATIVIPLLRQVDTWLDQCVRSALTQTIPAQVIVVRSELTPPSNLQILSRLERAFPNLQVLVEDRPGSFPGAINQGIRHASADRVGLLLSDDWLEKEAIEATVKETADIVSTGYIVHFADGRPDLVSEDRSIAAFHACSTLEEKASFLRHFFLFRTAAVLSAGGLDESIGNYPGIDDFDLIWTLLERGATVAVVPRRLYHYRDHEQERLTLQSAEAMTCNLRKILHKHGVSERDAPRIIAKHAPWYGHPVSKVLNDMERVPFASICKYANGLGLKRFLLIGTVASEYVEDRASSEFREGRPIVVSVNPKGRSRIRAPFTWLGHVICTQPELLSGFYLCFDLLRSGYTWVHTATAFGGQRNLLIARLMRIILERMGWPVGPEAAPRAMVQALAKPRDPTYTPAHKRILMITSTFNRGGSERQMLTTASALLDAGYDVRFLALGRTGPHTPTIEHEILKLGVKPEYYTDFPPSDGAQPAAFEADRVNGIYELPPWFSARASAVVSAIRTYRPAVTHCWLEMPGMIAALTACSLGVPRVVLGQRNAVSYMDGAGYTEALKDFLASAYPALAKNPNAIIVNNSASAARQYEGDFGLSRNSIRVVYNGFSPDTLRKPASNEVSEFRRRYGLNDDTPVVGTLMRFVKNKDPAMWVEVAAEVAAARPDVRFFMGGYGEMEAAISDRIKSLGLEHRVILLGPIEDIGLFYAAVDVVLLTSIAEGTPNVLIEAQAAGRPVIAPDVGGVAEAMANGLSGRLVAVRSVEHFARAVMAVLQDEEWRNEARLHGQAFIAERFGVDRMLRETLALYGIEGE